MSDLPAQSVEAFDELATKGATTFLNRISLLQPLSDAVSKGKPANCKAGDFILGFDNNAVLFGREFEAVVGPWRPHAIYINDRKVESESFDSSSPEFKKIEEQTGQRVQGAAFGMDFLLWIPKIKQFGYFFFSKTARAEAPNALALQGKLSVFRAVFVETKRFKWWAPKVEAPAVTTYEPAPENKHKAALAIFTNPHGEGVEEAPAGDEVVR
jgi:hypothetical protein